MTFPPAIKELLAIHEIFRRLGFLANDLYVEFFSTPYVHIKFTVRHGVKTEPVFVVDINEDCSGVTPENWAKAAEWWNKACGEEVEKVKEIYEGSFAREHVVQLILVLSAKGLITDPTKAREVV